MAEKKARKHLIRVNPDDMIDGSVAESVLSGMAQRNAPVVMPEEPSMLRSLGDSGIAAGTGLVTGVKLISDAFGADNAVSRGLGDVNQGMQGLLSPYRQAELQNRARLIREAEQSGSTAQEIGAYLGGLTEAPLDTLLNVAGTAVPTVASMFVPGAREANVARLLGVGAGALQGAGAGKSAIYDAVLQQKLQEGKTEAEARAIADAAQAYSGPNTDTILANTALGAVAGGSGLESAAHALRFGKAAQAAPGLLRRTATGAVVEGLPEAGQGGMEQASANIAMQREGYDVPTMRGVAGSAALEGVAGGALGGVMAIPTPAEPVAPPAAEPVIPVTGPLTKAVNAGNGPMANAVSQANANALANLDQLAQEEAGAEPPPVAPADPLKAYRATPQPSPEQKAAADQALSAEADQNELAGVVPEVSRPAAVSAPAAPAAPAQPASPGFATLDAADAYVDAQVKRNGSAMGVPVENEDGSIALVPKGDARYTQAIRDRMARKKARKEAANADAGRAGAVGQPGAVGPADADGVVAGPGVDAAPVDAGSPGVPAGDGAVGDGPGPRNDALTPSMVAATNRQPTGLGPQPIAGQPNGTRGTTAADVIKPAPKAEQAATNQRETWEKGEADRLGLRIGGAGWTKTVGNLGEVVVDFDSNPGEPLRAKVHADYMGKRFDTRVAEGEAAIRQAIEDASAGIQKGREKLAANAKADESGVRADKKPAASLPAPAPDENSPAAIWTRTPTAERLGILARAGWKSAADGKPGAGAQTTANRAWDKLSATQKARITAALSGQPANAQAAEGTGTQAPQAPADQTPAATGSDAARAEQQPVDAGAGSAPVEADGVKPKRSPPSVGDVLFDQYGDDYRIDGEKIGEVRLTKNRDKGSEKKVVMDSATFERLLKEDAEFRAESATANKPKTPAPEKTLDEQLADLNNELENQGQVQNANTRAKRDRIREQIAERDFPEILQAVDGAFNVAEELNAAFKYAGDEPKAKTIARIFKKRGITDEYAKRWTERLLGADAGQADDTMADPEMAAYEGGKSGKTRAQDKAKVAEDAARAKAQADLDAALGDLGDIFGKNTRLTIMPEQEQKLLPVLTRVMDAAFRLGYYKFKDAARFALQTIRAKLGAEVADQLTLDHLQGAYIGMAGKYQDKGADTKRAVIEVESLAELEEAKAPAPATTPEAKKDDPRPYLDGAEGRNAVAQSVADRLIGGEPFATIVEARKFVAVLTGQKIEPGTRAAKMADEAVEMGVAIAARDIVRSARKQGRSDEVIYKRLVALYEDQPNLGVRDSDSIRNQAYSTPAPLAFVASRLAQIQAGQKVGEPTAGNGMLVMEVAPENATLNELNPDRAGNLGAMGFQGVRERNAARYTLAPAKSLDAVVMNPPFGVVRDEDGETIKYEVLPNYTTGEVDHAIVFKALESMKDDGNAVLIIGGTLAESEEGRKDAYRGKAKREFFYNLHQQYNVVDHFTVGGDLYKKQGTAYPVDVIVIRGRGASARALPAANLPPIIETWAQLQEKLNAEFDRLGARGDGDTRGNRSEGGDAAEPAVVPQPPRVPGPANGDGRQSGRIDASAKPADGGGSAGSADAGRGTGRVDPGVGERSGSEPTAGTGDSRPAAGPAPSAAQQPGSRGGAASDNAADVGERTGGQPDRTRLTDEDAGKLQVKYNNFSGNKSVNTLVPTSHLSALENAFENLRKRVGPIDTFVRERLQYDEAGFKKAFSAEQVEALALAIDNIERGRGFIIGDQTGIGKGRVVAAMIRYAKLNGKTPVFVTQMPDLYGDMMRDLNDIGMAGFKPLMTNNNASVPLDAEALDWFTETQGIKTRIAELEDAVAELVAADLKEPVGADELTTLVKKAMKASTNPEVISLRDEIADLKESMPKKRGKFLDTPAIDKHEAELARMVSEGSIGDYGAIFTTYNQMAALDSGAPKRAKDGTKIPASAPKFAYRSTFLDAMVNQNAMLILDESHNAGEAGDGKFPKVGDTVRSLVNKAGSAFYSSATFAKNPAVMDVYSKTDLGRAFTTPDQLSNAIRTIPQQQVASAMLVEAGQYIRRERSFDGIEYKTQTVEGDTQAAEDVSTAMRLMVEFDEAKKAAIADIQNDLDAEGAVMASTGGGMSSGSVTSTNFTGVMHNVVNTFLLALKADAAADVAIEAIKRGEKPVLTVANTMELFITDYAQSAGLGMGSELKATFADVLMRYLEKTRYARIKHANGEEEVVRLSDRELGPDAVQVYESAREFIQQMDLRIPLSPIDHIKERIREAGYVIGEVTGRQTVVEGGVIRPRNKAELNTAGKKNTIAKFNGGQIDALIINRSGSTGLSMHASETFADQRRRVMVIAQAELDINNHMQMLGRTNRTGQVTQAPAKLPKGPATYGLPRYVQLSANVPIELRPAAVLAAKMAGLNANTTAGRKSAVEDSSALDFMNKYGDEVAASIVGNDNELNQRLGWPVFVDQNGVPSSMGAAARVTGRIGLLPLREQSAIYERINNEYRDLIAQLDAMGRNDLEAKTYPLEAKVVNTEQVAEGDESSPFTAPVVAERMEVRKLGKPYTSEKVRALVAEALGGKTAQQQYNAVIDEFKKAARDEMTAAQLEANAAKDPAAANAALAKRRANMEAAFARFAAIAPRLGEPVVIKTSEGNIYGVPYALDRKKGAKSVAALSSWQVAIAVVDGSRVMRFPLSQVFAKDGETQAESAVVIQPASTMNVVNADRNGFDEVPVIDAFDRGQTDAREMRTVMTGNLLRASASFPGRLISFTTADGSVRQGLLTPATFDLKAAQAKMTPELSDPAQIVSFLEAGGRVVDRETGGDILSARKIHKFEISTAKTGKGKKIATDAGLYMVSSGSRMRANIWPNPETPAELRDFFEKVLRTVKVPLTTSADTKDLLGKPARFSRNRAGNGVPMRDAQAAVALIRRELPNAPDIVILADNNDAPAGLQNDIRNAGAEFDWEAAYYDGKIYVKPDHIADLDRFMFVVGRHEVRHAGFDAMLGDQKDAVLLSIGRANRRVMLEARQKMSDGLAKSFTVAVEEALADMPVEDIAALSRIKILVSAIRRWLRATAQKLRKAGLTALANAIEPKTWTDNDVIAFVAKSESMSRGGGGIGAQFSRQPGFFFDAKESPLYKERDGKGVVSGEKAQAALATDAVARRIMAKGIEVQDGDLVGVRLNINVLKNTGVPVNTIHRGGKTDGYTKNRGLWGGEVIAYEPVVTVREAYLNVGQKAREAIASGADSKSPMASVDGRYVKTDKHSFDGVEFRFNPAREHLFRDGLGRVLKYADEVTVTGHSVYARGRIEYYGAEDVPARAGDAPTQGRLFEPGNDTGTALFSRAKVVTNDEGHPEFQHGDTKLAFPIRTQRIEVIEGPGQRVMSYAIMPADGFDVLGHVELLLENGRPVSLLDIVAYDRGNGVGRKAVETLLRAYPDAYLNISNIVPEAQGFWERMGIPTQNLEEGAAYDGTLDLQTYLEAQDGEGPKGGPGRAGAQGRRSYPGAKGGAPGAVQARQVGARFSRRNSLATLREAGARKAEAVRAANLFAGYKVGDFMASTGRLSWWDKTIGTPFNLAKRHPDTFGKVYDNVQAFLNDVSYYATEAANLAPTILPKMETLADLKKQAIDPKDNKAVAAPIFEGTLTWTRDKGGKAVPMEKAEADAAKMTTEEKAQELLRANALDPKVLRMWKGLPLDQYEAMVNTRYTNQLLRPGVVWSDTELRNQFGLSQKQIDLYREFRAAIDRSLDDLMASEVVRLTRKSLPDMAQKEGQSADDFAMEVRDALYELGADDLGDTVAQMANRVRDLKEKGYAPLSRFGQYTLDVVDADGERVYFGLFESQAEANKKARELRAEFPQAEITQGTQSQEAYKMLAGVSPETIELFGEILGLDATGDSASDEAFQEYLKRAKSTRSAMKRLIHRKGIAGFSEDTGRVLAGFITSNARRTASNRNLKAVMESVEAIPKSQGELKDYAAKVAEYVNNPVEEAQALRGLMFAQYLGGSVASALVNMTQPIAVTLPFLSQFTTAAKAAKLVTGALADMASRKKLEEGLAQALLLAEEKGIVAPQEIHYLAAMARGQSALRSGDGTTAGNTLAAAQNGLSRLSVAWGKLFGFAELVNRRATFIASYRLAVANGYPDPFKFAADAVDETQFVYNKGNRPQWARGAVGATLFTFKTYSISYMELLARMWKLGGPDGKKAFALAIVTMLLMSGLDELPFMEDAEDVVDGFAQKVLGLNWQTKMKRHEFLANVLGKDLAEFLNKGVSGVPGVPLDVSGRLGMGNLIPGTGLFRGDSQSMGRDVAEIAGPVADLVKRAGSAIGMAAQGDLGKAALEVSPVAIRNVAKAADMADTGMYRDAQGRKVVDTTMGEALLKGIGFQPNSVAKIQDGSAMKQRMIALNKIVEGEIADQWAQGRFENDPAKVEKARNRLKEWNKDNPDSPIRIEQSQIMRRLKQMRLSKQERIDKTAPKELRAEVKREVTQ